MGKVGLEVGSGLEQELTDSSPSSSKTTEYTTTRAWTALAAMANSSTLVSIPNLTGRHPAALQ